MHSEAQNMSPMMRQYFEIKATQKDAILFFRLGDFYEMFYEDAETAARELSLTLTGRGKKETGNRMPMCGIPYHAADNYILRLVNKGYKIAICEQVEDPSLAKGLTKREVIKVITPGTLTEEKLLTNVSSNYLTAVIESEKKEDVFGLAFCDVSTGEFKLTEIFRKTNLRHELARLETVELIANSEALLKEFNNPSTLVNTPGLEQAKKIIKGQCAIDDQKNYQLAEHSLGILAAAALLGYVQKNQRTKLGQINNIEVYQPGHYMYIDSASRRNLELTQTIKTQERHGSLYWLLDKTKTAMGSRLLKSWINYPLLDPQKVEERYNAVEELLSKQLEREDLAGILQNVYDIERLIGRAANGNANARDLVSLKESLKLLQENVIPLLQNFSAAMLIKLNDPTLWQVILKTIKLIADSLVDEPPLQLKEGNIIRPGYSAELDQLRTLILDSKTWVTEFETKEKERTGIKSLKVGYTSVFGYYIEISNANKHLAPPEYQRKQTLTNAERYITPELKDQETKILNAETKIEKLEYRLFSELREKTASHIREIQKIAKLTAELDVLVSLATVAAHNNFCRPRILNSAGRSSILSLAAILSSRLPCRTPNLFAITRSLTVKQGLSCFLVRICLENQPICAKPRSSYYLHKSVLLYQPTKWSMT
jgi:DNA mismatch repair protein MutS